MTHHLIFLLRGIGHRAIDGLTFLLSRHQVLSFCHAVYFTAIRRTIEQRRLAILLAVQIAAQREDVIRRILTHRRLGIGPNEDDTIATVADEHHQQAG